MTPLSPHFQPTDQPTTHRSPSAVLAAAHPPHSLTHHVLHTYACMQAESRHYQLRADELDARHLASDLASLELRWLLCGDVSEGVAAGLLRASPLSEPHLSQSLTSLRASQCVPPFLLPPRYGDLHAFGAGLALLQLVQAAIALQRKARPLRVLRASRAWPDKGRGPTV